MTSAQATSPPVHGTKNVRHFPFTRVLVGLNDVAVRDEDPSVYSAVVSTYLSLRTTNVNYWAKLPSMENGSVLLRICAAPSDVEFTS